MALFEPTTSCAPQWSVQAEQFDTIVRETVEQILGTKLTADCYEQACMSTKIGGLGIRRVAHHADGAFTASWHEASRTAIEEWSKPVSCGPEHQYQSVVSANLDRSILDGLISRAGKRDAQRSSAIGCGSRQSLDLCPAFYCK